MSIFPIYSFDYEWNCGALFITLVILLAIRIPYLAVEVEVKLVSLGRFMFLAMDISKHFQKSSTRVSVIQKTKLIWAVNEWYLQKGCWCRQVLGNASCKWQWYEHRIWFSDIVYQWSRWSRTAEWCLSVRLQKVCPEGRPGGTSSFPSHVAGSLCWGWAGCGVEFCHGLTVSLGFPGGCSTAFSTSYCTDWHHLCPVLAGLLHSKLQRARTWISTFGFLPLPYVAQCFIHNWTLFKNA